MTIDYLHILNVFKILLSYLHVTLLLSAVSMVLALLLGALIAVVEFYNIKYLQWINKVFISFFRGTPLIVQLFFLYYGLPQMFDIFKKLSPIAAAVIALSLHFSAYMAETIRASLNSIDKGQIEAGYSVGMTDAMILRRILFPQAVRVAIPPLTNSFIDIVKSSSLAFTLGVTEIMAKSQLEAASSYKFFESYLAVAVLYWVIVSVLTRLQRYFEKKFKNA